MTETTVTFTVRGRLPTQNELVALNARSHHAYNARKKAAHQLVAAAARGIVQTFDQVKMDLVLLEPNERFDPDNVACGAMKCILDGLQLSGVLLDDGWENILSISFSWATSPEGPAVRVSITGEANVSTTSRERRIQQLRRAHRAKATRAKKATERARHHAVHGKPALPAQKPGSKKASARLPQQRRR